jgi:hypothetical protein
MYNPNEFFQFLKNPKYPDSDRKETPVFITTIKIYLLSLLFIGLVNVIATTILRFFLTPPIDETFDIPDKLKNHLWIYFLFVAFLGPATEEIIFRLSLIFSPKNIALSVSVLLAILIKGLSNYVISGISFFLIYFLIYKLTTVYKLNLTSFWTKNFKYIFYFLPVAFGLLHMTNYKYTEAYQYLIGPIVVLPELAIGFILSFTRIYYKKGFLICLLTHVTMNLITVSLVMRHLF